MFDKTKYLVKERVAFLKLTDTYDIFDPETGQAVGMAKEVASPLNRILRLFMNKLMLPTSVEIRSREDAPPELTIRRGVTFFRSKIRILDKSGRDIGFFRSKVFTIGGGFRVFDKEGRQVAEVKGDWKGWNFRFLGANGAELGTVTKKWAGIGKELFTSADNYMIALNDSVGADPTLMSLLLAAGLAIDIVFKER